MGTLRSRWSNCMVSMQGSGTYQLKHRPIAGVQKPYVSVLKALCGTNGYASRLLTLLPRTASAHRQTAANCITYSHRSIRAYVPTLHWILC